MTSTRAGKNTNIQASSVVVLKKVIINDINSFSSLPLFLCRSINNATWLNVNLLALSALSLFRGLQNVLLGDTR